MAKIFISYSHSDLEFAEQLCKDLTVAGHTPWLDTLRLEPGDSIVSKIEAGLANSHYVVVVLSKAAVESSWVNAEWTTTFMDAVERKHVQLIPALKEQCEPPRFLRGVLYADFTKSYAVGFALLAMKLRSAFLTPRFPEDTLPREYLRAIEHTARTHPEDHIRLACFHALWSYRPDRARPVLEDALYDKRDVVRNHARVLLNELS